MWIKTCALVYVDEIQTNCFVTNTDFAWTWLTYRYIDDLEFFRPAVFSMMTALLMVCAPRGSIIFNALHPAMKAVTELSPRFYALR